MVLIFGCGVLKTFVKAVPKTTSSLNIVCPLAINSLSSAATLTTEGRMG